MADREQEIERISAIIVKHFKCFGVGAAPPAWGNPIAAALSDAEPMFAAGVSVRDVVSSVLSHARHS